MKRKGKPKHQDGYGKCRICLTYSKLTEDHVPPQGGVDTKAVEIENALNFLTGRNPKRNFYISQNGVKFRTLCGHCNNTQLGKKYDPVLNTFANDVSRYVHSSLVFQNPFPIIIKLSGSGASGQVQFFLISNRTGIECVSDGSQLR